jgi:protocatechuate 3,4-dioxygenase beta subunit
MFNTLQYFSLWICFAIQLASCGNNIKLQEQTDPETKSQTSGKVGGPCDTCELMYIDMPATINDVDTSDAWYGKGQKLIITGTVYKLDKKTPVPGIIIYYWQTNEKGLYADHPTLNQEAKRHGYIRGWLKTDSQGKYTIHTIQPTSYPNSRNPAHIHLLIKEPNIDNEYYIDDVKFDNDPLLTSEIREKRPLRAGNGIVSLTDKNGVLLANRDIILGLNIENYPQ